MALAIDIVKTFVPIHNTCTLNDAAISTEGRIDSLQTRIAEVKAIQNARALSEYEREYIDANLERFEDELARLKDEIEQT